MVELDEPIKDYNSFFKDQHAQNVSEYFEELVRTSGVNEEENKSTVAQLRVYETSLAESSSSRKWWRVGRVLLILAAISLGAGAFTQQGWYYALLAPAVGAIVFIFWKVNPEVSSLNDQVKELEKKRDEQAGLAWIQMDPLNRLHTWEAGRELFNKTYPSIQFDSYFSNGRLADLQTNYGLSPSFNDGKSIFLSHSGTLKNNPFVFTRYMQHWIGTMTYTGSLTIYWTETTRDAQGNYINVQKSQTLTASVVKPYPEFAIRTGIIYGHESAPNLSFSRTPSNLSGLDEGVLNTWRKDHAVRKVERKARKDLKSGKGNLTVMANREFEALFNATDRDHEMEFRLLFTPLAQQEIVNILNDKSVGYGDNFAFEKQGMVNFVEAGHLREARIDCDPRMFHTLELEHARKFFNEFHNEYFRSLYFCLAPLLSVPLYREARSMAFNNQITQASQSCYWEHEAMANFIGENSFKHPESVTRNVLKTYSNGGGRYTSSVSVTAYGYRGDPRVDYVPMLGGDGRVHQVPVPWTEYIPVERSSTIVVGALKDFEKGSDNATNAEIDSEWSKVFANYGIDKERIYVHGALAGAIVN